MDILQELGLNPAGLGTGLLFGAVGWFVVRCVLTGFFTVDQSERAVKVRFGRAVRLPGEPTTKVGPISEGLARTDEDRYVYPQLEVIPPGGPYFKWPWERVVHVAVATQTLNMAYDPDNPNANQGGTMLDAVTKDQLNTGLTGQLRYRVSEQNLYAYLFGVKKPIAHVMGYFISILRERIANFEAPVPPRRRGHPRGRRGHGRLRRLHQRPAQEPARPQRAHGPRVQGQPARYGIVLDASLITGIDPPHEVESALAAINTAHNHVSSDISLAQASADQKIVQSRRAVEIETLKAQAEVEPLTAVAAQLTLLKQSGPGALAAYVRNIAPRPLLQGEPGGPGGEVMSGFIVGAVLGFFGMAIGVPVFLGLCRMFGLYVTVRGAHRARLRAVRPGGRRCSTSPACTSSGPAWGRKALLVNWLGRCHVIDLRLDQEYLRSQAVNSEEGAPMGIGIWYEMFICDPVKYLFKNTDPRGSLAANVSNATVRCLSNMKLSRHARDPP